MFDNDYSNDFNDFNDYPQRGNQGVYSGYQTPVTPNPSPMPQNDNRVPRKKKGGAFKKVVLASVMGLAFGVFAGGGFLAVKGVADLVNPPKQEQQEIPTAPAISDSVQNTIESTDAKDAVTVKAVTTDVTDVVKNVMPSVVSITNVFTQTTNFFGQKLESQNQASGSGIIVGENDTELLVVTNHHVIEGADTLSVQFIDGEQVEAQVKGYDSEKDLAVIAIPLDKIESQTKSSIAIAKLGDSDALSVGEPAIAIGNSLGYGQSVTTGVISALDRKAHDMNNGNPLIQTDAAINPGNSGGALLNVNGEVIGINSNKIGGTIVEGMGYAIPISSAKPIIEELMSKTTKTKVAEGDKSYLGISGVNVTEEVSQMYNMPKGIYVGQVYEGTAAQRAGIVKGDIITKFDGSSVASMEELQKMMQYYAAGEEVELTIQQGSPDGYTEKKVTVVLGKREEE